MMFRAVLPALTFLVVLSCHAAQITLSLGTIRHEAFEAGNVTLAFDAARRGEADIRIGMLKVAGNEYQALRLHCVDFFFDGRRLDCPQGSLRREDERGADRPSLPFTLHWRNDGFLDFSLKGAEAVAFSPLVKRLRVWKPQGRVDMALKIEAGHAELDLASHELSFASREGDIRGKEISFTLHAGGTRSPSGWDWHANLDWPQGELWRAPWRRQAGIRMTAQGRLAAKSLAVSLARLDVDGLGGVTASLDWDREQGEARGGGFITDRIDLAATMRDWLQPWLTSLGFPRWELTGQGRISAEWQDRKLRRFYAGLDEARLADDTGYIALRGVNAQIPWEAEGTSEAEISVTSGRLGDLPLGGFKLPLKIHGSEASVANLTIPMLDGRFVIDSLSLTKSQSGWNGAFEGGIEEVSMPKLSRALKLPVMAGSLTARIPRIAYQPGELRLDGALGIEVFDGGIIVYQLRLIDPFSKERRLVADVTARNLDLGMLTRTFAFGTIEGRFDADLHNLEMQGWQPLKFDARIASSEGDYPRSLSFGALKDITALGQSGEPKSLERMPARSGFSFGYERIGFGCALRNGVCLLDGVEREGKGVVLMRGTGMPSVSIIGYNRHIDWQALVARLREVIAGRPGVVIE